ncbi:MAG: DoxX family protein [Planctomycetaceae bacterium]|nr:DoxX family protein [Planctomycetaceae bacterium]
MFPEYRNLLYNLGRALMSLIFVASGAMKVMQWSATAEHMAQEGMQAVPMFLAGAIVIELGAGLCLMIGYQPRWAAVLLALFLVPVTLVFHDFWSYADAQQATNQLQHFLKNVTIIGGLLTLAALAPPRRSLQPEATRSMERDLTLEAYEPSTLRSLRGTLLLAFVLSWHKKTAEFNAC